MDLHPLRLNSCRNVSLNFRTEREPNLKAINTLFNIMSYCLTIQSTHSHRTQDCPVKALPRTDRSYVLAFQAQHDWEHPKRLYPLFIFSQEISFLKMVMDYRNSINSVLMMQQNAFHKWQTKYAFKHGSKL